MRLWQAVRLVFSNEVPVFVILLYRDADRCDHVFRDVVPKLKRCEVVAATDAAKDDIETFQRHSQQTVKFDGYSKFTRAKLACSISHLRVWQIVADRGLPHAVVLEDDVAVADGFGDYVRRLKRRLPNPCDFVHLDVHPKFRDAWSERLAIANGPVVDFVPDWGRPAYLVTRSGARKLLQEFRTIFDHGDMQIAELARRGVLSLYCASELHVENLGQSESRYRGERFRSTVYPH